MSNTTIDTDAPSPASKRRPAKSRDAISRAADGIDANPLALVAGGLVLGVALGALLPRSERERQLLGPVGAKLGAGVTAAIAAGREAGKAELDDLGINREAARDQVKTLIDGLLKAAGSAGAAATQAAKDKAGG